MIEDEARDFFDRTPILPGHVRVLVQLGDRQHFVEMPAAQIRPDLLDYERRQPKGKKLKRYTDQSCERVTLSMMAADIKGDAYEVCIGALWLIFRRKNEKANAYEATKCLAETMDQHDACWIIIVGDETVDLRSLQFIIAAPHWSPNRPDPEIDMTPRHAPLGIYGDRAQRADRSLH
jgi:hypothetical protein